MSFVLGVVFGTQTLINPTLQNDTTKEWRKVTEEGRALCEEIEKLPEGPKEGTDSTE
jgi:hypothetical protein